MKTLQNYRNDIDALDDRIISLLEERFKIVKKVGNYKVEHALDVVQTGRVQEVLDRVRGLALTHTLDPDFIENLYKIMIDHAHTLESGIRDSHGKR